MKKVLILYFSGAGATKNVAELMLSALPQEHGADLFSLENSAAFDMNAYDALIIGTPVYHTSPSRVVMDFFSGIHLLNRPTPAFIYNTRGLYPCNTNRILAKLLKKKNIITIMDREYRSPASDVSLLLPCMKRLFEFEKTLRDKIAVDCAEFAGLLQKENLHGYIPRFRLSSILNAPNKLAGQLTTFTIYLHGDRCIKCGECTQNCPHNAIEKDSSDYPVFLKRNCENCYRCIHHCPRMALSLSKRRKVEKVVSYD